MARVQVERCPTCGRRRGEKHVITTRVPSLRQLERMANAATVPATDGCTVEPDGYCEHGHQSWLLRLHYI
jgi:hypothetical protein